MIAKVALRIPNAEPFDYLIPTAMVSEVEVGKRVVVPVKARITNGVVTAIAETSAFPDLRSIVKVIDSSSLFSPAMLRLTEWISSYYACSWGEVLDSALPSGLNARYKLVLRINREGEGWKKLPEESQSHLTSYEGEPQAKVTVAMEQHGLSELLLQCEKSRVIGWENVFQGQKVKALEEILLSRNPTSPKKSFRNGSKASRILEILAKKSEVNKTQLLEQVENGSTVINKLLQEGVLLSRTITVEPELESETVEKQPFLKLNPEQDHILTSIKEALSAEKFQPFLIHGVTGSGKTEVYLNAVKETSKRGKSALILIPEIALTPQLLARFRSRFGDRVAVLHSGMSERKRFNEWWQVKRGIKTIVVGTRSAIYAPLENIGLVVVDEEHDLSYKQNETPRYHGRDVAIKQAYDSNCVILLGSATPSAESYYNVQKGKYKLLELKTRANQKELPQTTVINLKQEVRYPGVFYLSSRLVNELKENFQQQKQSLLFLNRRGYAAFLSCSSCGSPVLCRSCSITLTWHKKSGLLHCHYCGYSQKPPSACEVCSTHDFKEEGMGTQRVERDLKRIFPTGRFIRIDRDTVSRAGELESKLKLVEENAVDFIIGTQLISKGHDYPNIGLSCIILADMSLNIPDFRASERTFQLLSQVSGRAGRGEKGEGKTIIQSFNPEHFSIECAKSHSFEQFIHKELEQRKFFENPPYTRAVLLRLSGLQYESVRNESFALSHLLTQKNRDNAIRILGPVESPILKIKNRYYWQILLKSANGAYLRSFCRQLLQGRSAWKPRRNIRLSIDIDPYFSV